MRTTVEIASLIDGKSLRTRVKVTPEQMEKFYQILEKNPGMSEMEALKKAKGIHQPKPTFRS